MGAWEAWCVSLGGEPGATRSSPSAWPPLPAALQGLSSLLLALFGGILAAGVAQSDLPHALLAGHADWGALQPAVPIMFLAL